MKLEEIKEAVRSHPNIQELSRKSGVSAQCLYFMKRGERYQPKDSTLRMIERALNFIPKNRIKYSPHTERVIDIVRTYGVIDTDSAAISSILSAAEEINAAE